MLSWKTIDKLEAKVSGARNSYKGEDCEFEVRLGRPFSPLRLSSGDEDSPEPERFRIENKMLDIAVEAATLHEAKQLLREKLAASDDFNGTWKLWMRVDVSGGFTVSEDYGEEDARCAIRIRYYVELITGSDKNLRRRHGTLPGKVPAPFIGEFPVPTSHKELSRLQNGPVHDKRDKWSKDQLWIEATPEIVETVRMLQRRLGESGDKVKEALSKKRFLKTLAAVQSGARLLTTNLTGE